MDESDTNLEHLVICRKTCDAAETSDDGAYLYGCPTDVAGMTYDSGICATAYMMDIPADTPFLLVQGDGTDLPIQSCTMNGITTESYSSYAERFFVKECISGIVEYI